MPQSHLSFISDVLLIRSFSKRQPLQPELFPSLLDSWESSQLSRNSHLNSMDLHLLSFPDDNSWHGALLSRSLESSSQCR